MLLSLLGPLVAFVVGVTDDALSMSEKTNVCACTSFSVCWISNRVASCNTACHQVRRKVPPLSVAFALGVTDVAWKMI